MAIGSDRAYAGGYPDRGEATVACRRLDQFAAARAAEAIRTGNLKLGTPNRARRHLDGSATASAELNEVDVSVRTAVERPQATEGIG